MPLIITYTFAPGQIIFASRFNQNFQDVIDWADTHELLDTGVHGVGAGLIMGTTLIQNVLNKTFLDNIVFRSGTSFNGTLDHANTAARTWRFPDRDGEVLLDTSPFVTDQLVPIGGAIPFQDFGGLVTFSTTYWKFMDGTAVTQTGPLLGVTTTDTSGRYLVGFGTDGGGDIGTATWATAPVGNVDHEINIEHSHTIDPHLHTGPSHTHTVDPHSHTVTNHTHSAGSLITGGIPQTGNGNFSINTGGVETLQITLTPASVQGDHAHPISGTTGGAAPTTDAVGLTTNPSGTGNTSATGLTTDLSLSTTQSIQPHSIRVRFIQKVA